MLKLNNEEANGMVRYTLTTTVLQKIKKKRYRIYQSPASSTFKKKKNGEFKKKNLLTDGLVNEGTFFFSGTFIFAEKNQFNLAKITKPLKRSKVFTHPCVYNTTGSIRICLS